jgi:hypothetical protein
MSVTSKPRHDERNKRGNIARLRTTNGAPFARRESLDEIAPSRPRSSCVYLVAELAAAVTRQHRS